MGIAILVVVIGIAAIVYSLTKKGEAAPPATYTCPYCGAVFSSQALLNAHIAAEHLTGTVNLLSGWNDITYQGKTQKWGEAIASIKPYLVLAYILHEDSGLWYIMHPEDSIWSGRVLKINVSQHCVWTF